MIVTSIIIKVDVSKSRVLMVGKLLMKFVAIGFCHENIIAFFAETGYYSSF